MSNQHFFWKRWRISTASIESQIYGSTTLFRGRIHLNLHLELWNYSRNVMHDIGHKSCGFTLRSFMECRAALDKVTLRSLVGCPTGLVTVASPIVCPDLGRVPHLGQGPVEHSHHNCLARARQPLRLNGYSQLLTGFECRQSRAIYACIEFHPLG